MAVCNFKVMILMYELLQISKPKKYAKVIVEPKELASQIERNELQNEGETRTQFSIHKTGRNF